MMDIECPDCGHWFDTNEAEEVQPFGSIEPEVADGFKMGRKGLECRVPNVYKDSPVRAGSWEHGWRQGNAVWKQMRKDNA